MSLVTLIHKYINNDSTGDIPNSLQHLVCVTDCILLFYFSFSVRQSVFVSPKIKNLFSVYTDNSAYQLDSLQLD